MPIYEYEAIDVEKGCNYCARPFEFLQGINESPLTRCPRCDQVVRKVVSWCRAAVTEISEDSQQVERKIGHYEKSGMWSHAAELADKYSEKSGDQSMKMRALEDYNKAGYEASSLEKWAKTENK